VKGPSKAVDEEVHTLPSVVVVGSAWDVQSVAEEPVLLRHPKCLP
jgi:hypothetical protein